jgi:bacteriochlorophyll 4-vinyl reductase
MTDAGVGRLLVASLHQGIADLLPSRLEFYESWLNPSGLREGRIGLAPLAAVLSFLRQEGAPYHLVAARAGEYTAEWMVADLPPLERAIIRGAPAALRPRLVMRVARRMVRNTFGGSDARIKWAKDRAAVDLQGSVFCQVRDRTANPLCEFYAAALRRLMYLLNVEADVGTEQCRATGAGQCLMTVLVRVPGK